MNEASVYTSVFELVDRCGYDRKFREKFLSDPRATFKSEGIEVPAELEIEIIHDEDNKLKVIVPVFNDSPLEISNDHPLLSHK